MKKLIVFTLFLITAFNCYGQVFPAWITPPANYHGEPTTPSVYPLETPSFTHAYLTPSKNNALIGIKIDLMIISSSGSFFLEQILKINIEQYVIEQYFKDRGVTLDMNQSHSTNIFTPLMISYQFGNTDSCGPLLPIADHISWTNSETGDDEFISITGSVYSCHNNFALNSKELSVKSQKNVPLKEGIIVMKRLGVDNLTNEIEIVEGYTKRAPILSAGHYEIELVDSGDKKCSFVDHNFILTPEMLISSDPINIKIKCQGMCKWKVEVNGRSNGSEWTDRGIVPYDINGHAVFDQVIIEVDPEMNCSPDLPIEIQGFFMLDQTIVGPSEVSGFMDDDQLFIAFVAKYQGVNSPFAFEFNHSNPIDDGDTTLGSMMGCGLFPDPTAMCSTPDLLSKIKKGEEFTFNVKNKPFMGMDQHENFTFTFTPIIED